MGAPPPFRRQHAIWLVAATIALVSAVPGAATETQSPDALVGSTEVAPATGFADEGNALAFATTATSKGTLTELRLFVDPANQATRIIVGLYGEHLGHPGKLLTRGEIAKPSPGWNAAQVEPTKVKAGHEYWIALLGPLGSGRPHFRNHCCESGQALARSTSSMELTDLPETWISGHWSSRNGPWSAYAVGDFEPAAEPAPPPATTTAATPPATTPTTTTTAATPTTPTTTPSPPPTSASTTPTTTTAGSLTTPAAAPSASAAAKDTEAPSAPTKLRVKPGTLSQDSLVLVWDPSTDNVGVAVYRIYRNGVKLGEGAGSAGGWLDQWTVTGLACGSSSTYTVDAVDAAGNVSAPASLTASTAACSPSAPAEPPRDKTSPSEPDELRVTSTTGSSVAIAWNASTDDVGVVEYGVYRNGTLVDSTRETNYTLGSLECGTSYTVAVDAVDEAENRSQKATVAATTRACGDTQPPSAPSNLRVKPGTLARTSLVLVWDASTDNVGVTLYRIYRNGVKLGEGPGSAGGWLDQWTVTGLTCGTSSTYAVEALDAAGNASSRATLTATTAACGDTSPPIAPTLLSVTGTTPTSISLSWTASIDNVGVAGYGLYVDGEAAGTSSSPAATLSGLRCGSDYLVEVDAFDAAGNRSTKASVWAATATCLDSVDPTAPTNFRVTATTQTSLTTSWSAASDNVGVTGYRLFLNGATKGTTTSLGYGFTGLQCGTTYSLAVEAYDGSGNSSPRVQLSTATSACAPSLPPPPSGSASLYMSPAGSDSNACTQISPCKSLDRAYRAAQPGQIVEIAAGTYAAERINADAAKSSSTDVVFRPAPGAIVSFGEVTIYADHLELRDLRLTGGWKTFAETDDVTFRNVSSLHMFLWSSSNISVIGGEVGPNPRTTYDSQITTYSGSQKPPTNILIDGVSFHDWIDVDPGNANHIECLQIGSGVNVTIRNSRFWNCSTHDIFIRSWGTINGSYHPLKNFVVENNFFAKTLNGYYAIQFVDDMAPDATSFLVRNNSSLQSFHDNVSRGTISFTANIFDSMTSWECGQSSSSRYSYNVYESGAKCGATDLVGAITYRNRAALDLHLMPGSSAINRGNPNSYPSTDIDGQSRPIGGAPDAGADEAG